MPRFHRNHRTILRSIVARGGPRWCSAGGDTGDDCNDGFLRGGCRIERRMDWPAALGILPLHPLPNRKYRSERYRSRGGDCTFWKIKISWYLSILLSLYGPGPSRCNKPRILLVGYQWIPVGNAFLSAVDFSAFFATNTIFSFLLKHVTWKNVIPSQIIYLHFFYF